MKLWYLAHPVSPCERYTLEENLAHTLKVARIFWDADFLVCVPWYAQCLFLDDANKEHRELSLQAGEETCRQLKHIILTGHKVTAGMQRELNAVIAVGGRILDFTTIPDKQLPALLRWTR